MPSYEEKLLQDAIKAYPFISQHNPVVISNPMENAGYAETWPKDEEGPENSPRPKQFPIDRLGVEVRNPSSFTHHDLAGELLHIDPMAAKVRDALAKSWTPKQIQKLKEHSLDYQTTLDEGRPEIDAIKNATDSAIRGYTIGQWPKEVHKEMGYSSNQKKLLDDLKKYMTSIPSKKSGGSVQMPRAYSSGNWKLI